MYGKTNSERKHDFEEELESGMVVIEHNGTKAKASFQRRSGRWR